MTDLIGTHWRRKRDRSLMLVVEVGDGWVMLRTVRRAPCQRRHVEVTPETLRRNYRPVTSTEQNGS